MSRLHHAPPLQAPPSLASAAPPHPHSLHYIPYQPASFNQQQPQQQPHRPNTSLSSRSHLSSRAGGVRSHTPNSVFSNNGNPLAPTPPAATLSTAQQSLQFQHDNLRKYNLTSTTSVRRRPRTSVGHGGSSSSSSEEKQEFLSSGTDIGRSSSSSTNQHRFSTPLPPTSTYGQNDSKQQQQSFYATVQTGFEPAAVFHTRAVHSSIGSRRPRSRSPGSPTRNSHSPTRAMTAAASSRPATVDPDAPLVSFRGAPLSSTDLSWDGAHLPPSLEPKNLIDSSLRDASHHLSWVHSGVFAPVSHQNLVQRITRGGTKQEPLDSSALQLTSARATFPPPRLQLTNDATSSVGNAAVAQQLDSPQQQEREEEDAPAGIDMHKLLYGLKAAPSAAEPSRPTTSASFSSTSSSIIPPPSSSAPASREGVASSFDGFAALTGGHRSMSSWLAALDDQYEKDWAQVESKAIEEEQKRIINEYESKQHDAWLRNRKATSKKVLQARKEKAQKEAQKLQEVAAAQRREQLKQQQALQHAEEDRKIEQERVALGLAEEPIVIENEDAAALAAEHEDAFEDLPVSPKPNISVVVDGQDEPTTLISPSRKTMGDFEREKERERERLRLERLRESEIVPTRSQFAAYDPSIDEGIDIAALPLAFQLPAGGISPSGAVDPNSMSLNHLAKATKAKIHPALLPKESPRTLVQSAQEKMSAIENHLISVRAADLSSFSQTTAPLSKIDALELALLAKVNALASADDDVPISVALRSHEVDAQLGDGHPDFVTVNEEGVDVEQAAALEAFDQSKASAIPVLQRYEAYQQKVKSRQAIKEEDRLKAINESAFDLPKLQESASEQQLAASQIEEQEKAAVEGEESEVANTNPENNAAAAAGDDPAHMRSPSRMASYMKHPSSAGVFFGKAPATPSGVPPSPSARAAGGIGLVDLNYPALGTEDVQTNTGNSNVGPHLLKRQITGGNIIKTVGVRTSGWGSQIAKQLQEKEREKRGLAHKFKDENNAAVIPSDSIVDEPPVELVRMATAATLEEQQRPSSSSSLGLVGPDGRPPRYARNLVRHTQRSWKNRIKRQGIGESAGRGSDAITTTATTTVSAEGTQSPEADANTVPLSPEAAARRERDREEKEAAMAMSMPLGARGTPSPIVSHALPTLEASKELASERAAESAAAATNLPHYMLKIDRSVSRATRRENLKISREAHDEDAKNESMLLSKLVHSSAEHTSVLPHAKIFPQWLWSRPDFQTSYKSVPFDTCLRILHMFPDHRTELHINKLREWIIGRALQNQSVNTASSSQHASSRSRSTSPTPQTRSHQASRHVSQSPSRTASRSPSRSPSRRDLHHHPHPHPHHSHHSSTMSTASSASSTVHVTLPPSTSDYLASLPRVVLDGVLKVMKAQSFKAGETVWKQGKEGDFFGILATGKLQSRRVEKATAANTNGASQQSGAHSARGAHGRKLSKSSAFSSASHASGGSQSARPSHSSKGSPVVRGAAGPVSVSFSPLGSPAAAHRPSISMSSTISSSGGNVETTQLICPGSCFGHDRSSGDIEATNHAQLQRKRTLRLWHLLRLSVRKGLRDDEGLYSQLSRLSYDTSHNSPNPPPRSHQGGVARGGASAIATGQHLPAQGHHAGEGLSQTKIRKETVVALTDCTVFTISFYAFASIEFEFQQQKLEEGIRFLGQVPFFRTWVFSRLRHLYSLLLPKTLHKGEYVWKQGSPADEIVFVENGALALTREVVVTESHRHPINHTQWSCEEHTFVLPSRPFAVAEGNDYFGEDLLDQPVRDFSVRCKSDTARVWFLRKRYIHLLGRFKHYLEDVSRVRRSASQSAVQSLLIEKYGAHHAAEPFKSVDWVSVRADAGHKNLNPAAIPSLHYTSGASIDALGLKEFLYLDAGAIYVRFDPPPALLRMISVAGSGEEEGDTTQPNLQQNVSNPELEKQRELGRERKLKHDRRNSILVAPSAEAKSLPGATSTSISTSISIPIRPKKILRIFTAPSNGRPEDQDDYEACFQLVRDDVVEPKVYYNHHAHVHAHDSRTPRLITHIRRSRDEARASQVLQLEEGFYQKNQNLYNTHNQPRAISPQSFAQSRPHSSQASAHPPRHHHHHHHHQPHSPHDAHHHHHAPFTSSASGGRGRKTKPVMHYPENISLATMSDVVHHVVTSARSSPAVQPRTLK